MTSAATVPGIPAPDTYVPKYLAEKILASRHKLEGERKQVTVLFADIKGSTKLIENLDPEESQKVIDPVLRIMMDAVHRYEGTVNQVLGDGVMALFGAPLAHEDHALRACYAALAMQDEMRRYRQKLGQSEETGLQIGVGMNSGEVVVRSIDNDLNIDYSALGHTTHLAARMQELSGPGEALISGSTLRQVEGFIQIQPLGPVQVKGVSQAIEVYSVIGATSARTRVQAGAARGLTPLVGRSAEIDVFKKLVEQVTEGRGQILAMIGEAGMGKSRLVHEFTRHKLPIGWLVLEATSVSYGKATPYFPLVEMLRRYCGIGPGEGIEEIQSHVLSHIVELDSALKDTIPSVLSLFGALPEEKTSSEHDGNEQQPLANIAEVIKSFNSMDPQQRRRHTLDAIKRIWIRESQRQNLLLVFEDLHWIDHETQAFLDIMVESVPMARLMLLVNYRPEYNHQWSDKSYYTQLRVDPLQTSNAEELLSKLLGSNPDLAPLKQVLAKRTEGNPFFAEESVRSLVESGFLIGEKGAYRPGLRVDDLIIPTTVQNVVADRIDRLPIAQKHLLQTAAVVGVIIPFGLLRAVADLPDEELRQLLARLQSAEFIYESNLFPELEYSFKHALTNEVAYGALLRERKAHLHAKIVGVLEESTVNNPRDQIESLAHHAFHGELWEKAVDYLRQSGHKAAARSANRAAVDFYDRSLAALEHLPQGIEALRREVDIRLELRNPLFLLGQLEELHLNLTQAEAIAEKVGDHKRLGRVLNFLVGYYSVVGDHTRAIESGRRALRVNPDDVELSTVTRYYMGAAFHHMAKYDQSISILDQALAAVKDERFEHERFGTATIISVICRTWLTQCFAQLGEFKKGIPIAEIGIRVAEKNEHAYSLAYATCSLGFLYLVKGDLETAIIWLERSQKICESSEIRVLTTQVGSNLGYAYALSGRITDGVPLLERANEQSQAIGRKGGWALRLTWLAHASLLEGRIVAAREHCQRALALAGAGGERGYQAWALKVLGDIVQEEGAGPSEALDHYSASMKLATELAMRPLQAHIHLSRGRLYSREKQVEKARTELSLALTSYRSMEMPFWLNAAEHELNTLVH